jgi:hypothetical protein
MAKAQGEQLVKGEDKGRAGPELVRPMFSVSASGDRALTPAFDPLPLTRRAPPMANKPLRPARQRPHCLSQSATSPLARGSRERPS